DGDMIAIDVNERAIDLEVDPGELDRRRAELPPLAAPAGCGWLSVYARTVAPLGAGATLGQSPDRPCRAVRPHAQSPPCAQSAQSAQPAQSAQSAQATELIVNDIVNS